ncbi:MAG: hypothetical protein JXR10_17430 [Cyclobacteriaceae bacterium]
MLRRFIAAIFLLSVVSCLAGIFWQAEIQYLLPTPVPSDYQEIVVNTKIYVDDNSTDSLEKPVFYHFFTTNCPCSKFNLTHFNSLKRAFGDQIDFIVVLPEEDDIEKARPYFEGETKIIRDVNQQFAVASGVYSTPQAVIINTDRSLYFRGNYNKARYCSDPLSNYAQMALDSLQSNVAPPDFGPLASIAYGCGIEYKLTL